jgi:hypothetical protein
MKVEARHTEPLLVDDEINFLAILTGSMPVTHFAKHPYASFLEYRTRMIDGFRMSQLQVNEALLSLLWKLWSMSGFVCL